MAKKTKKAVKPIVKNIELELIKKNQDYYKKKNNLK